MPTNFQDFSTASVAITQLLSDHKEKIEKMKSLRQLRRLNINAEELRQNKQLPKSDTLLNLRVIDRNIKRSLPPLVNYLIQPANPVYFFEDGVKQEEISKEFTNKVKYEGWLIPWIRCFDGAEGYGYDALEVVHDPSKPGHVAFYHIGRNKLIIPPKTTRIQGAPLVGIQFDISPLMFSDLATKNRFDPSCVEMIRSEYSTTAREASFEVCIYKIFFKADGIVYVAWFSPKCSTWLKAPEPLNLGKSTEGVGVDPLTGLKTPQKINVPVGFYPITICQSEVTENEEVNSSEGICQKDAANQEAQISLYSAFVNGANRAASSMAAPRVNAEAGVTPKLIDTALVRDGVYDTPMDFFSPPYPDHSIIMGAQALDAKNLEDGGQISFSATNRVDSRKTAAEIAAAQSKEADLTTIKVVLIASFITETLTMAWYIIQAKAMQGEIEFLNQDVEVPSQSILGIQGPPTISKQNNLEAISKSYTLKAAGDSEVIEKKERLEKRKELLQVVTSTNNQALVTTFVLDILKDSLPDDYPKYEKLIQIESQYKNMAAGLLNAVKALMVDPATGQLRPEAQSIQGQISQIEQQLGG